MGLIVTKSNDELLAEENQEALEALEKAKIPEELSTSLSGYIKESWYKAKEEKQSTYDQMIKNLNQKNGVYDEGMLSDIREMGGSEVYMMITDTKNRSAIAWIDDIMFQPGVVPFDIEPTPLPTLTEEVEKYAIGVFLEESQKYFSNMLTQATQAGQMIDPESFMLEIKKAVPIFKKRFKAFRMQVAKDKAKEMKQKMNDQLTEGNFWEALAKTIYFLVVLKTGFIKGPILKKRNFKRLKAQGDGSAKVVVEEEYIPEWEWRSPFDIFPGKGSIRIGDTYIIDRIYLSKSEIQDLIGVPGFDEAQIKLVLQEYDEGKLRDWTWDEQERAEAEGRESSFIHEWDKIVCLNFWGPVPGRLLLEYGWAKNEIKEPTFDYQINAYQIGDHVVKAVLNKEPNGKIPIYKGSFVEDEGVFWGRALAETISDAQTVCNACARAVVNNVAMGSGPMVELNIDRLAPGENQNLVWPWRVFKVNRHMMEQGNAVNFFQPKMVAAELIQVYNQFSKIADEHCGVPAYAHGDPQVGGGGNTASGLSMLMTSAARGIKSVIRTIDRNIIEEAAEDLYYWNYENKEAQEYIGDVKIVARGSSALLAKEQKALRLTDFARATANEIDYSIMGKQGRQYILRETALSMDLEADKLVPEDTIIGAPIPTAPMTPGMAPPPNPTNLDLAGNPAQGSGQELFKSKGGG